MIDVDYAPAVFASIIATVFLLPALYGLLFVDRFWKENKANAKPEDDAFNE